MSAPYPPQQPQEKGDIAAQDAYPPPSQPQGAYPPSQPQGGYPAQPYPSQPQGGYPQGEQQPPPYQPGASQYPPNYAQDQQNVVVVTAPPVARTTVHRVERRPELGIVALIFSIITTIFLFFMGCWWAMPCSIVGIILGVIATSTGDSGNVDTAKNHFGISIGCTVFAWIFAIVGFIIIVAVAVSATATAVNEINNSNNIRN